MRNYDIYYIYCIYNKTTGKSYIGQRKCPRDKTPETDSYMGSGIILKKAQKKYGLENFEKYIKEICTTKGEADFLERRWIRFFRLGSYAEYNIADGGQGGNLGYLANEHRNATIQTDEYKQKMSEVSKGKKIGDLNPSRRLEVRAKISESLKGRKAPNKGKHHTNEAKQKMSIAQKKRDKSTFKSTVKKGFHWYTNGKENVRAYDCPLGYHLGRTFIPWNKK